MTHTSDGLKNHRMTFPAEESKEDEGLIIHSPNENQMKPQLQHHQA